MDHDKTGHIHCGRGWLRQTCPSTARKRAVWCRTTVLSSFVAPTQHAGNQLRAYGAAGGRNAGELVLVGHYTGACARSIAVLPGLRPRSSDNIRTTERGTSVSGPVRSVSEYFAYDTSDQPLGLQVLREQPRLDAATMVVGVLAIGASSGRSWTRYAELTMAVERHMSADALPRSRST